MRHRPRVREATLAALFVAGLVLQPLPVAAEELALWACGRGLGGTSKQVSAQLELRGHSVALPNRPPSGAPVTPPVTEPDAEAFIAQTAAAIASYYHAGPEEAAAVLVELDASAKLPQNSASPKLGPSAARVALTLIRVWLELGRSEQARLAARDYALRYPTLSPSVEDAPPDTLALLAASREELLEQRTSLLVEPAAGCRAWVNGVPGAGMLAVAPESEYAVLFRCQDGEEELVWLTPNMGDMAVALPSRLPVSTAAARASVGAGDAVLISKSAEELVLVLIRGGVTVRQTSGDEADVASLVDELVGFRRPERPWISAGEGAVYGAAIAMLGASMYGLYSSASRDEEIACSPSTPGERRCEGVERWVFDAEELRAAENAVSTRRAASWFGVVGAAGLAGLGLAMRFGGADDDASALVLRAEAD